jgi:hypothetical protein
MVPSTVLTIAANDEHPSCNIFSLSDTIRFGSVEFIADHFSSLSLSPMGDGSDAAVMFSTYGGPPSPVRP